MVNKLRREIGDIAVERLVIYVGSRPTAEASAYREEVFDKLLSGDDPFTKWRKAF